MACIKLEVCFRPCVACANLAYGTVRRRILHTCMWMYGNVYTCGNVSRRTLTQDIEYAKIICYLTVIYCAAVRRRTVTDGNATQHATKIDLCGMLRPSTYDDAVSVNNAVAVLSAYGDGIRRALASIGV